MVLHLRHFGTPSTPEESAHRAYDGRSIPIGTRVRENDDLSTGAAKQC